MTTLLHCDDQIDEKIYTNFVDHEFSESPFKPALRGESRADIQCEWNTMVESEIASIIDEGVVSSAQNKTDLRPKLFDTIDSLAAV